ncbi:MAG: glycoside hydrolase [Chthoniobacteraceae bacterium]|nr:glycoside hydrolase [Chthoniobacteraceae bacterium]
MKTLLRFLLVFAACTASNIAATVPNGGFENGMANWRPLWTRDPGAGTAVLDTQTVHSGKNAIRIEHHGKEDWSFEPDTRTSVEPGDLMELTAWVNIASREGGEVVLSVTTRDRENHVMDWIYAGRSPDAKPGWQRLTTRFIVPAEVTQIQPRLIGSGPVSLWMDDFSLEKKSLGIAREKGIPAVLTIRNAPLSVTLDTATANLTVEDRRNGHRYQQKATTPEMIVTAAKAGRDQIELTLHHVVSELSVRATIRLDADQPECILECAAQGPLPAPVHFPGPFLTQPGDYLVIPMNEGISYPVEDPAIEPMRLIAYGGHGICMAFWGATDGERGEMTLLETPDDAAIQIGRVEGKLTVAPEWESQRGQFGYARRLRYVFFDKGGHVAMAKRYRAYAKKIGLFKTLEQKRQENPNVDKLIGAVNVWCWEKDAVGIVKELQAAGIERILWSNEQPPETLKTLNALGVLTSRYDIYQDVMNPENIPFIRWPSPLWPTAAWPKDIMIDAHGSWQPGWPVEGKEGKWYSCGVLCDKRALDYARQRMSADLATHPYLCRFIDTTTATPWRECYNPAHPMTRTESKQAKMELLRYVSRDNKLVTGCETGHDASVPYLHYFEGMLSLGPYRVPEAGRDMERIWNDIPAPVAKYQMGHQYRLPLWELVYHDCVVAQWYWGDYSNKLPALWDKRDLFNVLYGTPPMFMFNRERWKANKARFEQSYRNTIPYARAAGYSEMTNHRFLTPDRSVQQTDFANGMSVTVNFGSEPYPQPGGGNIAPMGYRVTGLPDKAR